MTAIVTAASGNRKNTSAIKTFWLSRFLRRQLTNVKELIRFAFLKLRWARDQDPYVKVVLLHSSGYSKVLRTRAVVNGGKEVQWTPEHNNLLRFQLPPDEGNGAVTRVRMEVYDQQIGRDNLLGLCSRDIDLQACQNQPKNEVWKIRDTKAELSGWVEFTTNVRESRSASSRFVSRAVTPIGGSESPSTVTTPKGLRGGEAGEESTSSIKVVPFVDSPVNLRGEDNKPPDGGGGNKVAPLPVKKSSSADCESTQRPPGATGLGEDAGEVGVEDLTAPAAHSSSNAAKLLRRSLSLGTMEKKLIDSATKKFNKNAEAGVKKKKSKGGLKPKQFLEIELLRGWDLVNSGMRNDTGMLLAAISAVILYFVVGAVFYGLVEKWTVVESFYFSVVTLTTTGYGELAPTSAGSKIFTCFFAFLGIGIITSSLGLIGGYLIDEQSRLIVDSMALQRIHNQDKEHVVSFRPPSIGDNAKADSDPAEGAPAEGGTQGSEEKGWGKPKNKKRRSVDGDEEDEDASTSEEDEEDDDDLSGQFDLDGNQIGRGGLAQSSLKGLLTRMGAFVSRNVLGRQEIGKEGDRDVKTLLSETSQQPVAMVAGSYALSIVLLLVIGTLVFYFHENLDLVDAFYLSCISLATVGYGDVYPETKAGQVFTSLWLLCGTVVIAKAIGGSLSYVLDRQRRAITIQSWSGDQVNRSMLLSLDEDGDGIITKVEFLGRMLVKLKKVDARDVRAMLDLFNQLDRDGSGTLTEEDLLQDDFLDDFQLSTNLNSTPTSPADVHVNETVR